MSALDFLAGSRDAIIGRWKELILETYPSEGSGFFGREKDRFANPVGAIIAETVPVMYDEILAGLDAERFASVIEELVRVRAVQGFCASDAVRFIFLLKQAAAEEAEKREPGRFSPAEFAALGRRIDEAALLVFESYAACREKLAELKAREVLRRDYRGVKEIN